MPSPSSIDSARGVSRRSFLKAIPSVGLFAAGIVAGAPLLTSCSGGDPATGAASFEFKLAWIPSAEYAGFFVAQHDGLFAKAGVAPKILPGGPNSASIPLVTSKRSLVAVEAIPENVANAVKSGSPIKIVGAVFQKSPECWVSLAENPVAQPKDIEGKRLGITLAGRNTAIVFMERNGVDTSKVTLVPIQFDPAPLVNNEIDALWGLASNQPVTLELAGHPTHVMALADYGFNRMQNVLMVHEDTLKDKTKADTVRRFLAASQKGWASAIADPEKGAAVTVDAYGKDLGLKLSDQTAVLKAMIPYMARTTDKDKPAFWMSDALVQESITSLASIGITADAAIFTNELLS
ncbi:ABC transporter substrate-binding protein [Microbacterium sp. 2MCAF23]|uniref:ABC transporter substrate-binding protein n=1 Tax=Microbacterium sp. 2MCAF23 TaxID=3232985 RepID=UPI003F9B19D7